MVDIKTTGEQISILCHNGTIFDKPREKTGLAIKRHVGEREIYIIRNLAVPRHFVAYLVLISSIRVDPGPRNRGPISLLALKIRTPVANTRKLRSIGQVPVV
jgi:hypothetical protein